MMVFIVPRMKQSIWKGLEVWNQICKVLGCGWRIGFGKLKREYDEMSRGYRRIGIYFSTQGIHQEIRSQ